MRGNRRVRRKGMPRTTFGEEAVWDEENECWKVIRVTNYWVYQGSLVSEKDMHAYMYGISSINLQDKEVLAEIELKIDQSNCFYKS